ncbi:MAG: NADH-quinone oxidoreductase subunit NuoE [Nitrospiraceae bacterium]|nr:NADH-quinone oxidoreductase subunit NuoE [Nitrospiraceae bacterium]
MLSEKELAEVEKELAHYEKRKAGCIGALKAVQKHRGWISDECLKDIAQYLEMTPDELDNVATFYSSIYRRPVGRHVIFICDSVSCYTVGYRELLRHLSERLQIKPGQTTSDGRFTLLPAACLGVCEKAPALMIDEDVHGNLEPPEKVDEILERYK